MRELTFDVPSGLSLHDDVLHVALQTEPSRRAEAWELRLVRRGGGDTLVAACEAVTGQLRAAFPIHPLLDAPAGRWDVQLCHRQPSGETALPLISSPSSGHPRHFLDQRVGAHGLSAYLSDSVGSLVLYVAPHAQHQRTVAAENAKARFGDWLRELPLQEDLVLFESFLGKSYAGNPRYVYEALRQLRPDLRCVWAYSGNQPIPGDPPRVVRGSPDYYRLLAQAKYRVNNVLFAAHGRKPETVYLQTWHGTPLKRLSYDIEVAGPEADARENFYRESRGWSVLLSENSYSTDIFRRAFRYCGPILETGYPLTDPLFDAVMDRAALAARLGLSSDHSFVLYAPTWRDHKPIGAWRFDFDLQLDLQTLSSALAPKQTLLVKAHHLVAARLDPDALPANVVDLSHLDDINELCLLADVLITDYSSVLFDYAVTGKPILFYCYDLELYASEIRGFYLDMERDLPGPLAHTTEELAALLCDLPTVTAAYAGRYAAFRSRYCALNDGDVARRVVEAVFGGAPWP